MKTLRLIKFIPTQGQASRYWEEDGFRRNDSLSLSDLSAQQQDIVQAAMQWAVSQLPDGFTDLESVELRKAADVVTKWSDTEIDPENPDEQLPSVPLEYSPAFVAAIVGNGPLGQSAIEITSTPGPVADGMAQLWNEIDH